MVIEDAYAGVQAAKAAKMRYRLRETSAFLHKKKQFIFLQKLIPIWCRCISVTTTLSEEKLMEVGPELVRPDISKISLKDIQELGVST